MRSRPRRDRRVWGGGGLGGEFAVLCCAFALLGTSCALREVPDWDSFYARQPRSILVLPAENETTEAEAPRFLMSTVAKPLIARGYYVFPVEATSEILASEGFTDGAELFQVAPERFNRYLGADGILLVTIKSWDTVYAVLASRVTVAIEYILLDARTGTRLWSNTCVAERRSGGASSGNILADLVAAAINAALTAALTDYIPLAREANFRAFQALPPGVYHPDHESAKGRLLAEWRAYKEKRKPAQ